MKINLEVGATLKILQVSYDNNQFRFQFKGSRKVTSFR